MALIQMEREEIAIRVISIGYALGILGLVLRLQSQDINIIMLVTVFTMVFTCPLYVRYAVLANSGIKKHKPRRRMVVVPDKKEKKKPDIAVSKDKTPPRTQAQILAEQRERVRNLHGVADKKLKVKSPKRKQPPHLDKKQ
ncbi:hypothetical protein PINS_up007000 [Pythium insidiosum]|nr:hypothetical protein PINS_up007000 [Pythium insidiosum]